MKISYNWLKQYLDTTLSPDELSIVMTDIGLEVEGLEKWESVKGGLKGLVVGLVLTCEKHPGADKLSKTTVDVGGGIVLPIVCGAPNVAAGQKVVVATVGTTLYDGDTEFVIKNSKIRGEVSQGMICAEDEIGLGSSHAGIMVLPDNLEVGTPAAEVFKPESDVVFEIGLTPNRVDAASHFGVARDVAAYLSLRSGARIMQPSVAGFSVDNTLRIIPVEIRNAEACPRYSGLTISGLQIAESPVWLKNKLLSIGQRPINNVVDVTNFVLNELGHPLHAFDADKITGNVVVVGNQAEGTPFVTLDGVERKLSAADLMIANAQEPMCIAGVFGGADSGVTASTTSIFLESAYFHPVAVRKTSKKHLLHTDASFRFERGADPNIAIYALKRAALLIKEVAGGSISSDIVDVYPTPIAPVKVEFSFGNAHKLIGKRIPETEILQIFSALEIEILENRGSSLLLSIPTYRVDVTREADVIEEVLRIYGYNNVEFPEKLNASLSYVQSSDIHDKLQRSYSDGLSAMGFNEAMSNSLTKADYYENLDVFRAEETVVILNPLSSDLNALRQSLLMGGLEAVGRNINFKTSDLKLYEFGNVYRRGEQFTKTPLKGYAEEKHLALWLSGNKSAESWNQKAEPTDFYELKKYAESLLLRLGYSVSELETAELHNDLFQSGMSYGFNTKVVAQIGAVSKKLLKRFGIDQDVFYADLNWTLLLTKRPAKAPVVELSKFPSVRRDLALLVDSSVRFDALRKSALGVENKLLKKVSLFDVYEGKNLPEGKRSYALSFVIQDDNKTLNDKQID
ncbi:MAG: hypothetical protein RIS47_1914, partial [Bacteroidota bacterium]